MTGQESNKMAVGNAPQRGNSKYDHTSELQNSQPVKSRLQFLLKELGKWADFNPGLRPLYEELTYQVFQLPDE